MRRVGVSDGTIVWSSVGFLARGVHAMVTKRSRWRRCVVVGSGLRSYRVVVEHPSSKTVNRPLVLDLDGNLAESTPPLGVVIGKLLGYVVGVMKMAVMRTSLVNAIGLTNHIQAALVSMARP